MTCSARLPSGLNLSQPPIADEPKLILGRAVSAVHPAFALLAARAYRRHRGVPCNTRQQGAVAAAQRSLRACQSGYPPGLSGSSPDRRALNRVLVFFGLAHPEGGKPRTGLRRSRYGRVSPRLDEDVDDLKRRLEALERRQEDPEDR